MDYKNINDYEVLYLIRENSDVYLPMLVKKYKPVMSMFSLRYLSFVKKHGLEFDDLFQECIIALDDAIKSFKESKNVTFYTYACVCMKRRLLTLIRNCNRTNNNVLSDCDFDLDISNLADDTENIDQKGDYLDTIEKFSDFLGDYNIIDRSILELRINGFSYKEIGKLLDVSLKTVQSRLYIMRRKLKLEMNK